MFILLRRLVYKYYMFHIVNQYGSNIEKEEKHNYGCWCSGLLVYILRSCPTLVAADNNLHNAS